MTETPPNATDTRVQRQSDGIRSGHIVAILFVALALRLIHLDSIRQHAFVGLPEMGPDAAYNHQWATNAPPDCIASAPRSYYVSPLYPELLRGLYSLVGPLPTAARLIQALLGALTPILIYRITTRLHSSGAGLIAGLCAACYSAFIFHEGTLTKEAILPFLTALALDRLLVAVESDERSYRHYVVAGAVFGLLCLVRPNLLLFVALVGVWLVASRGMGPTTARIRKAFVLGAGVLVAISPVTIRNAWYAHDFVLMNSSGGLMFYEGNVQGGAGYYQGMPGISGTVLGEQVDARRIAESLTGRSLKDSEVSSYWYQKGLEEINADWPRWLGSMWRKFQLALNDLEIPHAEHFYFARTWSAALGLPLPTFGVILPFAILGAFTSRREWPRSLVLNLFALCLVLTLCMFYVSDRYRLPLVIVAIPYAACGAAWIWQVVRTHGWLHLIWATCLLGLLYAATFQSVGLPVRTDFSVPLINAANYFLDHDRPQDALPLLRRVETNNWRRAELYESLGRCLILLGNPADACKALDRAIEMGPGRYQGYFLRGQAHLALGQTDDAVTDFQSCLAIKPHGAEAHYYLGALYRRLGNYDAARKHLTSALTYQPELIPAHIEMSRVESLTGNDARAEAILRDALKQYPSDQRLRDELASLSSKVN